MKKRDPILMAAVFLMAVVFVGQAMIPTVSMQYSSEASVDGDGIRYGLSSDTDREFIATLFSDGGHYADGDVVIYRDDGYASFSDPKEVIHIEESLKLDLPMRGVGVQTMDAEGIAKMMHDALESGDTSLRLVMFSGVLPDTVYDGEGGLIIDWLEAGGVLYWNGAPLGKYIAHTDGTEEVLEYSQLFFGTDEAILDPEITPGNSEQNMVYGDVPDDGMAESLGLVANNCTFGIKVDSMPDSIVVANSSDDGYASIGLTKYHDGEGMICVFGGYITYDSVWAMSKVIASGLEYDSEIIETQTGRVDQSGHEGIIGSGKTSENMRLYLCIGVPIEVYGKGYTF